MSKLINIGNGTYEKLRAMKNEDESFTIVIEKLFERNDGVKKKKFSEFYGKGGIDEEAMRDVKKGWKKWTERYA